MRKLLKGFTLVEILIVIVIIGILIGALVPRMQSAQGRARDVARKNDLAQLQSAILTSYQDRGNWPGMPCNDEGNAGDPDDPENPEAGNANTCPTNGVGIDPNGAIADLILRAGMNSVPRDPIASNTVQGLGSADNEFGAGQYGYIVTSRNGTDGAGFVLMAKTEIEGGSNWIVCDDEDWEVAEGGDPDDPEAGGGDANNPGLITSSTNIGRNFQVCTTFEFDEDEGAKCSMSNGTCTYTEESQLRYILTY